MLATLASGHTGVATPRTQPELSDVALFVLAIVAVAFLRRSLRARFRRKDRPED